MMEKTKKRLSKKTKRMYIFCYVFISFALLHFAVFYVAVNINSILLAFKTPIRFDNGEMGYVASLQQFKRLFREFANPNTEIFIGTINTLKYFGLNILIMIPASMFISYFLYKKIPFYKGFRVILFLPSIISGVVFVSVFTLMLAPYGPIYMMFKNLFGVEMPFLLNQDSTATPTIMFYVFWTGLAGNMILYQGAMNRLPQEVIESGQLDGISWLRELVQIVIPMIWPTFSVTLILAFTTLFIGGGPILLFSEQGSTLGGHKTMTISFFIFLQTRNSLYEYPAAIGLFFTLCSLPIVFIVRLVLSKLDPEVEY